MSSEDQMELISRRVEAISQNRAHDLKAIKSQLADDVDIIASDVHNHISGKINQNRHQVHAAVNEFASSFQRSLGEDFLSMLSCFVESVQNCDFESLDISNWVNNSINLFEGHFGTLSVDQVKVLNIVNDFTTTWANKVENLKSANKSQYLSLPDAQPSGRSHSVGDEFSRGRELSSKDNSEIRSSPGRSESQEPGRSRTSEGSKPSPSQSDKRKGLFSKVTGLFKGDKSQSNSEKPTPINLGNDKNFRYDPIKKRYVFEGEDEEEEKLEDEKPPSMLASSQASQKETKTEEPKKEQSGAQSLVQPPGNRHLRDKKDPKKRSATADPKRPAFVPSKFVPTALEQEEEVREEEKKEEKGKEGMGQDLIDGIKRKIDRIFNQAVEEGVVIQGIERLRRDLRELGEVSVPNLHEEIAREAKFLVLESELESTYISIVRESYSRKLLETELSSLRESYQNAFGKEYELEESIRDLEKDLALYKDMYNAKAQLGNAISTTQMNQKTLESYWKSLKEISLERKKLIEMGKQLKATEVQLEESRAAVKATQAKYEQVIEHLNRENSASTQLKRLLEENFKAQQEQDKRIIELKQENLDMVTRYQELFEQAVGLQSDKKVLSVQLNQTKERAGELEIELSEMEDRVRESEAERERSEKEAQERLEKAEEDKEQRVRELSEKIDELVSEKEELENRLQEEQENRRQAEERANEEENLKNQAEERLQQEGEYTKQLQEKLQEEEELRSQVEEKLREEENARRELEEKLKEEEALRNEVEEKLNQEQRARNEVEESLREEETVRREVEEKLYQVEERLREEETIRSQVEERIQEEEATRRDLEERLANEETARRKAEEDAEEYLGRLDRISEEREDLERRLEESMENERRTRIQMEDYDRQLKNAWDEREQSQQLETQIRKEREKLLEELTESKSINQALVHEKELVLKFSEEVSNKNLLLDQEIQTLMAEVSRLNSERQRSIEIVQDFVRDLRRSLVNTTDMEALETYLAELAQSNVDLSERYFRVMGVFPKVRDTIMRELEVKRTQKDLEVENLSAQINNLVRERTFLEEQQIQIEEEARRLREMIETHNEQIQQYDQRYQDSAAEIQRLERELEEQLQKNLDLERYLHHNGLETGENLRAIHESQEFQISTIQGLGRQIDQLSELREEILRVKTQLEEEKTRNSHNNMVTGDLEEQINNLKRENQELQEEIDEGFKQYNFLQDKAKQILDQLKQEKEENVRLRSEQNVIIQEREDMGLKLVEAQTSEEKMAREQTMIIEELQAEKENLSQEIMNLNERIEMLSGEIFSRDQQIVSLEGRLRVEEENRVVSTEISQLTERVNEMSRIIEEKENNLSELQALREQALENVRALSEEKDSILGNLQALQAERDMALESLKNSEARISDLVEVSRVGQLANERAVETIKSLEARVESIGLLLGTVQAERDDLFRRLKEEETRNYSLNAILEQTQGSKVNMEGLQKEIEEKLLKLEEEKGLLCEERDRVSGERDDLATRTEDLMRERHQLLGERDDVVRERDQLLGERENLVRERDQLLSEREKIVAERDNTIREKEEAVKERDSMMLEREDLLRESLVARKQSEDAMDVIRQNEAAIRERDELRREVRQLQTALEQREEHKTMNLIDKEEFWSEIEREYGGSRVMDYLQTVRSKMENDKELSVEKVVGVLVKEFEEAIGEMSRMIEEKETTLIGLSRSLDDMNEQYQRVHNHMVMLEGEQSEIENYSSIRDLYEKKAKRVDELLKDIASKNAQIEQMKKILEEHGRSMDSPNKKGNEGENREDAPFKEQIASLKEEIDKEKLKNAKLAEEFESYRKKHQNSSEERGAIQHSYSQIIKNLSMQLDEVRKKKGLPTATLVNKGTQTGEDEHKKTAPVVAGEDPKKQGFLSGMAKFFLTEAELKKL